MVHSAMPHSAAGQRGLHMPGGSIRLRPAQLVKLAGGIAVIAQRQHRQAAQQGIVHAAGNRTVQEPFTRSAASG